MKKTIIKLLFLTVIALMLVNCQKEDPVYEKTKDKHEIKGSIIGIDEFRSDTQLIKKLDKIKSLKPDPTSSIKKGTYNAKYDFTIETEYAKLIEKDGVPSYTFPIVRKNKPNNNIENLVLTKKDDGSYEAILVNYDFTADELKEFNSKEDLEERTVTYEPIDIDYTFIRKKGYA